MSVYPLHLWFLKKDNFSFRLDHTLHCPRVVYQSLAKGCISVLERALLKYKI